jgi:ketosteroid isomerase-like protein
MAGFVASKPRIVMKVPIVVQSGDLALTVSEYTITSTGPDGKQTSSSARGTEVVRRQADGTWRFVIDNPTGTA